MDLLHGRVNATLINSGEVPENHISSVRSAQLEVVLLIVTIELGAESGGIAVLDAHR